MKRLFACLLAGLMLISCKAAEQKGDKSLLWRITGRGLKQPSYLFGTMHLICPDDYLWTDAMKKSLAACRQVCFELDMDDPGAMTEASDGFMSTDGKKLQDYFTVEQWKRLSQFMRDTIGADISQMQMMKPMVLESLLATKSVDCAFPISYEANIMEQAQKAKLGVVGMEEVQEQVALINGLPDDSVVAELMQTIDSFTSSKAEYAKMLGAYKQQDLPALFNQIQASKEMQDELGTFLDDRNKKWIPRMSKMMSDKPTFFAVGAGHLWGETGVITLLRKAGYTVAPVH